jgi:hypothetical protein
MSYIGNLPPDREEKEEKTSVSERLALSNMLFNA